VDITILDAASASYAATSKCRNQSMFGELQDLVKYEEEFLWSYEDCRALWQKRQAEVEDGPAPSAGQTLPRRLRLEDLF
jgi:hypothetical protein